MSTPAENIGANAAPDAASGGVPDLTTLAPEDAWITQTHIDDPVDGSPTPPAPVTPPAPDAAKPAEAAKVADAGPEAAKEPAAPADAAADVAKPGDAPPAAKAADTDTDPELSAEDKALIEKLPEAEQPAMRTKAKRAFFMDRYLDPEFPAKEVVNHLAQRSPSRFAEMETTILERHFAQPEGLATLFKQNPDLYAKVATEIYKGDPAYWTEQVAGREGVTPDQVKEALEFHDKYKDTLTDTDVDDLDAETMAELETYFPEKFAAIKKRLDTATRLAAEKTAQEAQAKQPDPAKTEETKAQEVKAQAEAAAREQAAQKEVEEIWDAGRDTVENFVATKAYDPKQGIGIHVTEAERTTAPLVARLKDFKASVFFDGLTVEGKPLVEDFQKGLIDWGKEQDPFKNVILGMDKYAKAREKQNVLELAQQVFPYADKYYAERLKHPIFAEIDQLIALAAKQTATTPKLDPQIPGQLPGQRGTQAAAGANPDAWLIQDAVSR